MKNEAVSKLERLKKQIESMPDNYYKKILLTNYYCLLSCLADNNLIDENQAKDYQIDDDISDYLKLLTKNNHKYLIELLNNNDQLLAIDAKLIDTYNQGNWHKWAKSYFISQEEGNKLLGNFFQSLGNEFIKLYNDIKKDHIFSIDEYFSNSDGACYRIIGNEYSYINVKMNDNNINNYLALVHEIGHVYQYYLLRNHGQVVCHSLDEEVLSLFLEKLFIKYLEKNYYYQNIANDLWYYYYYNQFWLLPDLLLTSILYQENHISYISPNLECESNLTDSALILKANTIGYETSCPNLNLHDYPYVIGNLISDHFLKIADIDLKEGIKAISNFVQESPYYSLDELLEKYASDLNYTQDNILKVIQKDISYKKRK